ncbi:MAG: RidA family protein [Pseudomonadota bacterium]
MANLILSLRRIAVAVVGFAAIAAPVAVAAQDLPYSPVVEANGVLYLAGHVGLNPEENKLSGNIETETQQALNNIYLTLSGAGSNLSEIVRCQVFLSDIDDYGKMNKAYAEFFPENPPARTTVAVAALPMGAKIEIECTAVRKNGFSQEAL